ncbi:Two component regulator propeller [Flexibacter flexilis DSM 6793]|uniref:Two component regulator propeller n=1 Tax=Flexibacter flexilis DSM 6793 TaxID=927664 RepID=A0A1I1E7V7_9BACT|nr:two-component regulator propeller domain-containing protein [Flexibacter flexilis]SFB83147.1 Two component regulator propeller [Flexibacter flexilis DSM 6793]
MRNFFGLLGFWLMLSLACKAQDERQLHSYFPHKHYTVNQGLASSTVYFTMQDSKGYLWIMTSSGVNRFDGQNFEYFSTDNGLSDNEVFKAYEDTQGRIWFLTYNGKLSYFFNNKFYNGNNTAFLAKAESPSQFTCIYEDKNNGDIWLGTFRNGIVRISGQQVQHYNVEVATSKMNVPCFFFRDKQGIICVQTYAGKMRFSSTNNLFRLYGERYKVGRKYYSVHEDEKASFYADSFSVHVEIGKYTYTVTDSVHFNFQNLNCFYIDPSDRLWIGTYNGVYVIENYQKPRHEQHRNHYLKGVEVGHFMRDHEGNLWCSTLNQGLYFFANKFDKINLYDQSTGLPSSKVTSLASCGEGMGLLVGFDNGQFGFWENKNLSLFQLKSPRQTNKIRQFVWAFGKLWIAADMGLYCWEGEDRPAVLKEVNSMKSILHDNQSLYSATSMGLSQYLPTPSGKDFRNYVLTNYPAAYTLCKGNNDTIWFATSKDLMYFDEASGQIGMSPLRFQSRITSILLLPDRSLLIGTAGLGLFQVQGQRIIKRVSVNNGLVSNVCNKLYMKDGRNIWGCTNNGLTHIQLAGKEWIISSITMAEGLPSNEINDVCADQHGNLYVATNNGLCHFSESDLKGLLPPPTLLISQVRIDDVLIKNPKKIALRTHENNLEFYFVGIAYRYANLVSYEYRLSRNGKDAPWITTTNGRLQLAELPHGDYVLQVRCRRFHSGWSNTEDVKFSIAAPFWLKWWFISLCSIALGILIWQIYTRRVSYLLIRERAKKMIQQRNHQLEQQALQLALKRDLLKQSSQTIQQLIKDDEKKQAYNSLNTFVNWVDTNINNSQQSFVTIAQEISTIQDFLELEKQRLGEQMSFQISISPKIDMDKMRIPPLILESYVDNAIQHGLAHKEKRGRINIVLERISENYLQIIIQDNGIGLEASRELYRAQGRLHKDTGLIVSRERIEQIRDTEGRHGSVSIEELKAPDNSVMGTVVVIQLPVRPIAL